MRLVRQVSLYFREGNSDKVYEIDLCTTGNDLYVVNFRYGRRGAVLKEGTKTPAPVSLFKAEELFAALEAEKRAKGYRLLDETTALSESVTPLVPVFTTLDIDQLPAGRKKAILKRLQNAVENKTSKQVPWKLSRVIWAAGFARFEEASGFIYQLAGKGDAMQQYACIWALGRCNAEQAIPLLFTLQKTGTPSMQRISAAAVLRVAKGKERERQVQFHLNSLPEPLQAAITSKDVSQLRELLQERILNQSNPHYNLLEDLYMLTLEYSWIKAHLFEVLLQLPLKPNYFKHIRHIFKLAEFFDDFETISILAHRFEKEVEMFFVNALAYEEERSIFVPVLRDYVNQKKELAKRNSKLAYSQRTRNYFIRRVLRSLDSFARIQDLNYVRLATGLLLGYNQEKDSSAAFESSRIIWGTSRYETVVTRFPANSKAVYLNQILFSDSDRYKLLAKNIWVTVDPAQTRAAKAPVQNQTDEGLVKKIFNFFTGKKPVVEPTKPVTPAVPPIESTATETAPHISLWNQLPQAFVQLLMHGRMDEIHRFAITHLKKHPEYNFIREKLDASAIEQMLVTGYSIPAEFALELALERYQPVNPDMQLIKAMLYGKLDKARQTAMNWVETKPKLFLSDSSFVAAILLCPEESCRSWLSRLLSIHSYTQTQATEIVNRTLLHILSFNNNSFELSTIISSAGGNLFRYFSAALQALDLNVINNLIQSKADATQLFGLDLLLLQSAHINADELSSELFYRTLDSEYAPIRIRAIDLLMKLSTAELLMRQELIMHCCTTKFRDIRSAIRPVISRMATYDHDFGKYAAEWLLPMLMRKESSDGIHEDVGNILQHELIDYVKDVNKELALRLLYSAYPATQQFGVAILERYIDAKGLTMRQIIALGNHETRVVREWCWRYYEENISRVKYEREDAIRILDVSWDDTREFAKSFFSKRFSEEDWTPEVLAGIADSVRPDIEAFGRELITRFFKDEQGEDYLLKLSEHPSEKMQLFATNYLERFAVDDELKLRSLEFYFRSVLTRVHKGRIAKKRVFSFLLQEGIKSESAARFVAGLIGQISATVSIQDKATCIEILLRLQSMYNVEVPITKRAVEERIYRLQN